MRQNQEPGSQHEENPSQSESEPPLYLLGELTNEEVEARKRYEQALIEEVNDNLELAHLSPEQIADLYRKELGDLVEAQPVLAVVEVDQNQAVKLVLTNCGSHPVECMAGQIAFEEMPMRHTLYRHKLKIFDVNLIMMGEVMRLQGFGDPFCSIDFDLSGIDHPGLAPSVIREVAAVVTVELSVNGTVRELNAYISCGQTR